MAQKTPKIQLILNVGEQPPGGARAREVIKKVTRGHEVVEVDGFTFKRARTSTAPENRGPNHSPSQLSAAAAPRPAASPATRRPGAPATGAGATPLSSSAPAATAQQLAALCSRLCLEEAAALGSEGQLAEALQQIAGGFGAAVAQAAAAGQIRVAQAGAAPQRQAAAHAQGATLPAPAPQRHPSSESEAATPEEAEWQALLGKAERLPELEAGAEAAAAADQQQRQQQQEDGSAGDPRPPEAVVLEQLHRDAHRRLAMQAGRGGGRAASAARPVEGVCMLVGDVEELVERASRNAQAVQAGYHAHKFQPFPHVESPAHLIKLLVAGRGGDEVGTAAAAQHQQQGRPEDAS
eukprot:scaffold11.g4054.t1